VKSKIWLEKDNELVFGEGKSELLKLIARCNSINKAADEMGISFRRAWSYITEIEKRLGVHLIKRKRGGSHGGGSRLTPYASELIEKYNILRDDINSYADHKAREIFSKWKDVRLSKSMPREKKR